MTKVSARVHWHGRPHDTEPCPKCGSRIGLVLGAYDGLYCRKCQACLFYLTDPQVEGLIPFLAKAQDFDGDVTIEIDGKVY